ncbi:MAG: nucleotide-binding protein [candidate division KSB1 bacterium]|nr:nucleotide-binding protein [candidate division KSB1 bacterium]MDZ7367271.1 nucleotide-binding protein [candidate division KSB1 bacterium]MDZ7405890.1 nucleotide-binding protein [candidate division KSB1 bacterium]
MADFLKSGILNDLAQALFELHNYQRISRQLYDALSKPRILRAIADELLFREKYELQKFDLRFERISMKAMDGEEFHFVRILFKSDLAQIPKWRLKVFLGHRFVDHITQPLRFNLARILDPYGIKLTLAGQEAASEPVLSDIVKKLRAADFAIFDNRETETKPNVYIEIGMSLILKLPFIVCDYRDPRRPDFDPLPSDLSGFLTVRYPDYKSLFTELALKLPSFIYQRVRPIKRR